VFVAAIMAGSRNADAATTLIKLLQSLEAAAVFREKGLDPS
jgi:hypothetical protein